MSAPCSAISCAALLLSGLFLAPLPSSAGEKAPRTLEEIKKTLSGILTPKKADEKEQALQKLKAYRYLAEVPYEDLGLDPEMNEACQAGAALCKKLGRLDHNPKNPGMPEDEFKLAHKGVSRSNLGGGFQNLADSIDAWMFDSDPGNIVMVGHRRWCINPHMGKTGFGRDGIFTAMYTFDQSRQKVPPYDFVCYPARGFMPVEFFGPQHAWSVSLNPNKFKVPPKEYAPKLYKADAEGEKMGEPLKLNFKNVDTFPFGVPICVIFRPEKVSLTPGARYRVELEGLQPKTGGEPVTLSYVVEFVKWK